jgi:hypothetical protein
MSTSLDSINQSYAKLTYVDKYNGSIFLVILATLVVFLICAYFSIFTNIQPIKDDWINQRCNPKVMPFAGFINKPDGETISQFTQSNFTYCTQNILTSITSEAIKPITFITTMLQNFYEELFQALEMVRTIFASIRSKTESVAREILGRVLNITVPLRVLLLTLMDSLSKVQGILTTALYTSLASYYTLKSLLGNIVNFIIVMLISMVGIIFGLWLMPFTWPMAISGTAIFVALSIPLAIVLNFLSSVLGIHSDLSIPKLKPIPKLCFDKSTLFVLTDGSAKCISGISVGDMLKGYDRVNATIKLLKDSNKSTRMYQLHGVTISDCHQVRHSGKWIPVCEHPHSVKVDIYHEKYIYCLSTTSKRIVLNDTVFMDWDELLDDDILRIHSEIIKRVKEPVLLKDDLLHRYGNGGLVPYTPIRMMSGYKNIIDICPGDVLFNGVKVYGTVIVDGSHNDQFIHVFNEGTFEGGSNICLFNEETKSIKSTFLQRYKNQVAIQKCKRLYHLLTDAKYFYITKKNIAICDYNYTMEVL